MNKKYLVLAGVVGTLAVYGLSGCGKTETAQSGQTDSAAAAEAGADGKEEQITLNFPHWFFSHGEALSEWINPAIEEFEKENPNIKINGYAIGYNEFWDKLDTSIASNDAPDIFALTNTNLSKYVEADTILPLDEYIDMNDITSNYSPIQTEDVLNCGKEGKTYCVITDMGFYLPMYRPSVLEKAGIAEYAKTPEEFVDMAKKLSALDNVNGYAAMINPGNWSEGSIDLSIWIIGLGGHYGENGKPALNSPEVVKAVTYLKELYDADVMVKETDKGTYRKMFATGNVGTLIDGQFLYSMACGWDPSLADDYAVADLPFPTQHCAAFFEGLSVSKSSKYPAEAAKFIEFLCSKEQQQKLVEITGFGTARNDIFADETFSNSIYDKWPWMEKYAEHQNEAVMNNPEGIGGNLLPEVQKILYTAYERILYENADITETLNAAQDEAMQLFD